MVKICSLEEIDAVAPFVCEYGRVIPYSQYEELAQSYKALWKELEALRVQLTLL